MQRVTKICVMTLALSVLWGCQGKTTEVNPQSNNALESTSGKVDNSSQLENLVSVIGNSHSENYAAVESAKPDEAPKSQQTAVESTSASSQPKLEGASPQKTEEPKASNYSAPSPYNAKTPTLMNLSIGDLKKKVTQIHGNPKHEYIMEDENESFLVIEYTGFSIGFNTDGGIQFIEISSDQVEPGLNGLRLGDKVDAAFKALGKPNTNTEFVLSYKSDNAILKLDVDPKTRIINSIKLFSNKV